MDKSILDYRKKGPYIENIKFAIVKVNDAYDMGCEITQDPEITDIKPKKIKIKTFVSPKIQADNPSNYQIVAQTILEEYFNIELQFLGEENIPIAPIMQQEYDVDCNILNSLQKDYTVFDDEGHESTYWVNLVGWEGYLDQLSIITGGDASAVIYVEVSIYQ